VIEIASPTQTNGQALMFRRGCPSFGSRRNYWPHDDRLVFSEDFIGAKATPTIEPIDPQPGAYNYLTGSDPKDWHAGAHDLSQIWDGIDIKITRNGADIEQEFLHHPVTDLTSLQIAYRGSDRLNAVEDGSLEINTYFGKLRETRPCRTLLSAMDT